MEKNFNLSLILGRFNHIHSGHKYIIDISRNLSKETLILIGSSQESGTLRNPFSAELRKKLIEKIYENDDSIRVEFLEDMITLALNDALRKIDNELEKVLGSQAGLMGGLF